jgi:hypothetical protein
VIPTNIITKGFEYPFSVVFQKSNNFMIEQLKQIFPDRPSFFRRKRPLRFEGSNNMFEYGIKSPDVR